MADHLDAPGLMSPSMDPAADITDIYAFQKPGDPSKSILILNVNPLAPTLSKQFDPTAIYEIKVDTNGDAVADIAYRITFTPPDRHGQQFAAVHMATGSAAAGAGREGEELFFNVPTSLTKTSKVFIASRGGYEFFAGMRSDPFFFDLLGFLNNFQFTGSDFFIDKNVFSIVLGVPNRAGLGPNPKVGIWARVLKPGAGGALTQIDRMGRPAINTVFNHGEDKNTFNHIQPTQDRTTLTVDDNPKKGVTFLESFTLTLQSFGHPRAEAEAIAKILVPDILAYDYSSAAGFLNGRKLTDDVIDIELALVTNGKVTTDKVGPHTDLLPKFPYMGAPH